ncbi:MAG: polyprenyl synthetase family protein, partial [Deltaproteobacteria bacterium]|nr:polyprenyl synthetase family protein [Deltaproteobacteria bacterium]
MQSAASLPSSESAKARLLKVLSSLSGMAAVDRLIREKLKSDAALLTEIPAYLLNLGGKRMRPALTLLTARAFGMPQASQALLDVAAGIELIHMATLLHDDIIDKAPTRRHQESAFMKFGLENTLLSGDFLLVRAFSLCARLDADIINATEDACIELTEGEILEVPLHKQEHSLESSLTIAKKKTAALFRLSAFSAAHLAGAGAAAAAKMAEFGEKLGIAFQILDDILDVTSDEDLLGKKSGLDLIERKPSVVNVLWLASGSPLSKRLRSAPDDQDELFAKQALAELRPGKVVQEARALALRFVDEAAQALSDAAKLAPRVDNAALEDLR